MAAYSFNQKLLLLLLYFSLFL